MNKLWIVGTALLLFTAMSSYGHAECPDIQQDEQLATTVQSYVGKPTFIYINSGSYFIRKHGFNDPYFETFDPQGEVSRYQYLFLQALEDIGLIELTGDERRGKQLSDRFNSFDSGDPTAIHVGKVAVAPTEKSKALSLSYGKKSDGSTVWLKTSSGSSIKIVDKDPLKIGSSTYAIVRSRATTNWTNDGLQLYDRLKESLTGISDLPSCLRANLEDSAYKWVILFKRDEFDCKWTYVTSDSSYASDGAICTNEVDKQIKALQ